MEKDAEQLYEALVQLVRVYQFRDREQICCHDISVTQGYALEALVERGQMRLGDLAEVLMIDKSTTSRVVDSLVRKGLIARVHSMEDRRAVRLAPTKKGDVLYQKIRVSMVDAKKVLIEDLSPEVRQAAIELIKRLTRAAEEGTRAAGACGPQKAPGVARRRQG